MYIVSRCGLFLKKAAGYKVVDDHFRSGILVGVGTGCAAIFAVERVGQKHKGDELKDITCIHSDHYVHCLKMWVV